jgi:hypothetical protein
MVQFIGSCKNGSSVILAISGSKVSTGVKVVAGRIAVTVGDENGVSVVAGAIVVVVVAEGSIDDTCVGCFVGLAGIHPTRAEVAIKKRDNKDNGFILPSFPIVSGF